MGKLLDSWRQIPLFWRMGLILIVIWLLLQIPTLPGGLVILYMIFALMGVFLYVTVEDHRIREFLAFFVDERPWVAKLRLATLIVIPLTAGGFTLRAVLPSYVPPFALFTLHPTPPEQVWQVPVPDWVLQWREEDVQQGKAIYENNCWYCHGKELDGQGPAAAGFQYPTAPVSFKDPGTIATLTLPYVFWKVSEGGLQNQFNSAMPAWRVDPHGHGETVHTGDLTDEEVWRVIQYIYRASGREPAAFGR
jgi:hypothetical protein